MSVKVFGFFFSPLNVPRPLFNEFSNWVILAYLAQVVFLVGLEEGVLPHWRSGEEGTRDEERRLLYVGITRAQEQLFLGFCALRRKYGELVRCDPSSFLEELAGEWIVKRDYVEEMNALADDDDVDEDDI